MRCADLMRREVVTVGPEETVEEAARRMRDADVGFLPVCDAEGRPVGVLTDRDVALGVVAERRPHDTPVHALMRRQVLACRPREDVRDAERRMEGHHQSRILCTDARGRLQGVLSLSDIAAHRARAARTLHPLGEGGPTVH